MNSQHAPYAALALATAIFLSGCSTTPAKVIFATKSGLVGAERVATVYASLPRCGPAVAKPCSSQEHVDTVLKTATATRATVKAAEAVVRDPASSKGALDQIATASAAALKALQAMLKDSTQ